MQMRKRYFNAILAAAMLGSGWPALAQNIYPNRSIQLVVPYTAGGNTDRLARIVAQRLTEAWGQPVVVDNRPGAGGTIGASIVVKAKPDGHTLFLGSFGNILTAKALYKSLPYDPAVDLVPVVLLATPPTVVTVPAKLPVKDIRGLIAYAKQSPGAINYGSSGNGTSNHLFGELFASMAGVRMTHVPYKGSGPAVTDLISGMTQLNFAPFPLVLPHIKAGTLRALAVTGPERSPTLPNVPTVSEAGLPGYEGIGWFALMTTKGTPEAVVLKINKEVNRILGEPDVRTELAADGAVPVGGSPADASHSVVAGVAKWGNLIQKLGLTLE